MHLVDPNQYFSARRVPWPHRRDVVLYAPDVRHRRVVPTRARSRVWGVRCGPGGDARCDFREKVREARVRKPRVVQRLRLPHRCEEALLAVGEWGERCIVDAVLYECDAGYEVLAAVHVRREAVGQ